MHWNKKTAFSHHQTCDSAMKVDDTAKLIQELDPVIPM